MPSITSWMRLEPRSRTAGMDTSLQARIYDPLWLLARQWQFGEFQGEDNGSPVLASWRAESARLTRYHAGPLALKDAVNAAPYDPTGIPLETLVEREATRSAPRAAPPLEKIRLAVETGQQFLRMLASQPLARGRDYSGAFTREYALQPLSAEQR